MHTATSSQAASPETVRPPGAGEHAGVAVLLILSSSSDAALEAEAALLRRLRLMVGSAIARQTTRENATRLLPRLYTRTAHWEPAWSSARRAAAAASSSSAPALPDAAPDAGDAVLRAAVAAALAASSASAMASSASAAAALATVRLSAALGTAATATIHADPTHSELARTLGFIASYAGHDAAPSSRAHRAVAQVSTHLE